MAALAAALLCFVPQAWSGFCGDDVAGERIGCDCGDIVVSDTSLRAEDPIIGKRCRFDGLVVRADPLAESITVNLGGLALVGSGLGAGIIVQRGGSDGAVIVGGDTPRVAEVAGFHIGVLVPVPGAVSRLERIAVRGNRSYGLMMRQAGAIVSDIVAERNGGHGVLIIGTGGRFVAIRADENDGKGIAIQSPGAILSDSSAILNGAAGIVSTGPATRLSEVEAHGNRSDGIRATGGKRTVVEGAAAVENGRKQIRSRETMGLRR